MLSSVSLGTGLKTRPTPPNGAPNATGPSSPKQDARPHCVTPDASAAVEALEASLEACLKSAAALGGSAPTGAAARLAAKADRLSKTVAALGETTRKAAPETSDDEAVDAGPRSAPGPSYWDHAREWHSCVNLGDSERARTSRRSSWRTLFNRRVLLGLVSGHEDPDDPRAMGCA